MQRNPEFAALERVGIHFDGALDYTPPEWKSDFQLAMDAQSPLVSVASSGVPAYLTTMVDPDVVRILTSPNKGAEILGERKKGTWLDQTAMFPVLEMTGEVSTYGDYNNNGRAGLNMSFPQRQAYLFQNIVNYGDLEAERAGLMKLNWASEQQAAAAAILDKFMNTTYFFGVQGLQNYGILNDPSLPAPIAPAPKAGGGVKWTTATTNEVYADVLALYGQLVAQSGGLIDEDTPLVLVLSPASSVYLKATNQFGINFADLLKQNFPNLRIVTAVQYGAASTTNPQGNAAGNLMQLIATSVQGMDTGYMAYSEKLRTFPLFRDLSSWRQKHSAGTWGAIIRVPYAVATMIGI